MRWLSRGRCLSRFWKLKNAVHDFLEVNNELPDESALLIDNNWLFNFAFLVDITSHLNDLNLKLQGKIKLFPSLVDCIKAFKMKLKLFIFQLKNQDLSHFPHLKEQRDISNNKGNMTKYVEKIKVIQDLFENRFQDFAKDEHSTIAFTNPFLLNDEQIMKMPSSIQMELLI